VFISTYGRYKQIKYYIQVKIPNIINANQLKYCDIDITKLVDRLNRLNFTSLLLAYVNLVSLVSVGNFRCNEAFLLHAIGAFCMFNTTFTYAGIMIYTSRQLDGHFGIESRPLTMGAGLLFALLSLLGCFVFSTISMFQFSYDRFFTEYDRLHWTGDQPGYWWHVLGTACEWLLLNSNAILFLCFYRRMKLFQEWDQVDL